MSEVDDTYPEWQDALCPDCGQPATRLGPVGVWHFECVPCGHRMWGHPMVRYGEAGASGVLHDARLKMAQER